jgi:hypothetical protein
MSQPRRSVSRLCLALSQRRRIGDNLVEKGEREADEEHGLYDYHHDAIALEPDLIRQRPVVKQKEVGQDHPEGRQFNNTWINTPSGLGFRALLRNVEGDIEFMYARRV